MAEKTAKKRTGKKAPRVSEAAAEYVTTNQTSLGDAIWLLFKALPDEEQGAFIRHMLGDQEWFEELEDSIMYLQRRDEPSRPYDEIRKEMIRDGLL